MILAYDAMSHHPPLPSTTPRKQPRQRRSTVTVAAILEAAARILETTGYDGYTTNAVAARAGVSVGSLYQYFPNRDAITRALIEQESSALLSDILAMPVHADGLEGVRALLAIAVHHQLRRPRLARFLDAEEARLPASAELQHNGERAAAVLRGCLERTGLEKEALAHTAVRDVMAITRGMVDSAGSHGETDEQALLLRVTAAVGGYLTAMAK
ncbi:MAG: hypothetical protein RLZZ237_3828 [Pseudomonadota bacterium]